MFTEVIKSGGKVASVLFAACLWVVAADAAVVPIIATGLADNRGNDQQCYQEAAQDAVAQALRQAMSGMTGRAQAESAMPTLLADRTVLKSIKLRKKSMNALGQCEVSLRAVIDQSRLQEVVEGKLAASIQVHDRQLSPVGAVMRFLVDGKVAEDAGFDTKESLTALGQALRKYNVDLVSLDPVATIFARQEIPQWQAVTGDVQSDGAVTGDSAQTAQYIRDAVHQALQMSLNALDQAELQSFDLLLTGQSDVRYIGRDPQGPGHVAQVSSYLELVAVNGMGTVATTTNTGLQKGPTREAAIRKAMIYSLEGNATALAAQIRKAAAKMQAEGQIYNVVVTNLTSNRKQLRPLIKGLQVGGAVLKKGRSDGDDVSKFNIAYRGDLAGLEDLLGTVLDRLAVDYPSVDYKINGNLIQVIF